MAGTENRGNQRFNIFFTGYALLNPVGRFRQTCLQQAGLSAVAQDVCFIFRIRNRVEYNRNLFLMKNRQ